MASIRLNLAFIFGFLAVFQSLQGQSRLRQIEPADTLSTGDSVASYLNYMVLTNDTITWPGEFRQKYLKLDSVMLFLKSDSVCFHLAETLDTHCVKIDTVQSLDTDTYIDSAKYVSDTLTLYRYDGTTFIDSVKVQIVGGGGTDTDVDSLALIGTVLHVYEDDKDRTVDLGSLPRDTLPTDRFVFTDPITGLETTDAIWEDSIVMLSGTTRYMLLDTFRNVGIGKQALGDSITSGFNNTGIGQQALFNIKAGHDNQAIGAGALMGQKDGEENVAIGKAALFTSVSDTNNVAIGTSALGLNAGGDHNTAIGKSALQNSTTGSFNTAIGYFSGLHNNGDNNVYIGNYAGDSLSIGDKQLFIGDTAGIENTIIYGAMATDSLDLNAVVSVRDVPHFDGDSIFSVGPNHRLSRMAVSDLQGVDTDSQNIHIYMPDASIWLSRSADTINIELPWAYSGDTTYDLLGTDNIIQHIGSPIYHEGRVNIGDNEDGSFNGGLRVAGRGGGYVTPGTVATFDNKAGTGSNIAIQHDNFDWRLGNDVSLTAQFRIIDFNHDPRRFPVTIDTSAVDRFMWISDTTFSLVAYPNDRTDSIGPAFRVWGSRDVNGDMVSIHPDSLTYNTVGRDYDIVKLINNNSLGGDIDALLPLDSSDIWELGWRGGNLRLIDTLWHDTYAPLLSFHPTDSTTALQITERHGVRVHDPTQSYYWMTIDKGDAYLRLHHDNNATDTLPAFVEIGVTSWYDSTGTNQLADTSQRRPFRISSQANDFAFDLRRDSLKLGDYPNTRDDSVSTSDITVMYVPDAQGFMKLASVDTINKALSVAASTPDITYFQLRGDSLGLNLNSTVDTSWALLSSLTPTGTANRVAYFDGTGALNDDLDFNYFETSGLLQTGGHLHIGLNASTTTSFEIGQGRTNDGIGHIDIHAQTGTDWEARILRNASANGSFLIANNGTGDFSLQTNGAVRLSMASTGQTRLHNYTSVDPFATTEIGLITHDGSGVLSSVDINDFINTGGTPNTVTYFNASGDETSEAGFEYDDAANEMEVRNLQIGAITNDRIRYTSSSRSWLTNLEAATMVHKPAGVADVFWQWRNTLDQNIMQLSTATRQALFYGEARFNGNAYFTDVVWDKDGQAGSSGQVLKSTGTNVDWGTDLVNDADASTTNELQDFSNTSTATTHRVTLSNSGADYLELAEGSGISLTTSGTTAQGIVTIAATGGGGDGDGIYDGSGTVPAGLVKATITDDLEFATGTGADEFIVDWGDDGSNDFHVSSSGVSILADGATEVRIGNETNNTDQLVIDGGASVVVLGEENNFANAALRFYNSGNVELVADGAGDDLTFSAGDDIIFDLGTEDLYLDGLSDDPFISNGASGITNAEAILWDSENSQILFYANGVLRNRFTTLGCGVNQTPTATYTLHVGGGLGVSGTTADKGSGGHWGTYSSDKRIKTDIEEIDIYDAMDVVLNFNPKTFRFKDFWVDTHDGVNNGVHYGYIAQDVENVLPNAVPVRDEFVAGDDDPIRGLNNDIIKSYEMAALRGAIKKIKELELRIEQLENK